MAADPDGMGSATVWQVIVTAFVGLVSFAGGTWARGSAAGKSEGALHERMSALSDRMMALERRQDGADDRLGDLNERIDEKISRLAERIAVTPTRDEIATMFARLEAKLDARRGAGG